MNPSFPGSQGDRRMDQDQQKALLSQLPANLTKPLSHLVSTTNTLPVSISHGVTSFPVTKTLTRQIAPAPGAQVLGTIARPVAAHQITNTQVIKKDIQKVPLSLTSTVTSLQTGAAGISNIIPVQISGGSVAAVSHGSSTLHVPNVSSIVRGGAPQTAGYSHLPRGVVAASAHVRAGTAVRQALPTSIQMPSHSSALPLSLQGQIRNVMPHMMRAGTPPTNRSVSPAVSIAQVSDAHRAGGISLHNVSTPSSTTPSIQITLQARTNLDPNIAGKTSTFQSRTNIDPNLVGKTSAFQTRTTLDPNIAALKTSTFQTRTNIDPVLAGKTTTFQNKVNVAPGAGVTMTPQAKVMTQSVQPIVYHPTPTIAGRNKRQLPSVTVALSTTTVTIPIISTSTTMSSIPIAKVPPQRHQQYQTLSHPISSSHHTTGGAHSVSGMMAAAHNISAGVVDHRTEAVTYPTPQPAHSHTQLGVSHASLNSQGQHTHVTLTSHSQGHTTVTPTITTPHTLATGTHGQTHGQTGSSLYLSQQQHRASPVITTVTNASHTESRETSMPTMPFFPPYMLSPDNPYYQQLMKYQVEAVAQQARARPGLLPQTQASLAASLQAAVGSSNVRFNHPSLMVMQDSLRGTTPHTTPQTIHTQYHNPGTDGNITKMSVSAVSSDVGMTTHQISVQQSSMASVAAVASSLYTATSQNVHAPQIGQAAPNTPSSTPINNPSASPRPSILRKRTNEGISAVKKQLAMTSSDLHSIRPEPRIDSTPVSNMSSPKTPASGESQSSTDTALSSEATTPTQTHGDKIKQEPPDLLENGFANIPEASPRKRRKQLLQATEEIRDTPVNVFDKLVEACIKEEENAELEDADYDDDPMSEDEKQDLREEYVDTDGVRWTFEKCRAGVSLLNFYNISWKPRNNHFVRYSDVKSKGTTDERRPTVNELSNQKGVVQKATGWKLYHMAAQIEDLMELEKELNSKISSLQSTLAPDTPLRLSTLEDESGMLHELTQGNVQRCKLISDQLSEAKSSMLKVLDHRPKVTEIISKHLSKRPIKKKERT